MKLNHILPILCLTGLFSSHLSLASDDVLSERESIEIAKEFARLQQLDKALIWYKVAAENGNIRALFIVGMAEIRGIGVQKNPTSGIKKISSAAKKGLDVAQFSLGYLYQKGKLGPVDYDKAHQWYLAAAKQQLAVAEVALGSLYAKGWGVEKNFDQAEKWFRHAYAKGHMVGGYNLAILMFKRGQSRGDLLRAINIFKRTAESGHTPSQLALSKIYLQGKKPDLLPSSEKAIFWLQKAAGQGSSQAQLSLGRLYLKGELLPTNAELAFYWLNKSARQGLVKAQLGLAAAMIKGDVLPKNLPEAYVWLSVASASGHAKAHEFKERLAKALTHERIWESDLKARKIMIDISNHSIKEKKEPLDQPLGAEYQGMSI